MTDTDPLHDNPNVPVERFRAYHAAHPDWGRLKKLMHEYDDQTRGVAVMECAAVGDFEGESLACMLGIFREDEREAIAAWEMPKEPVKAEPQPYCPVKQCLLVKGHQGAHVNGEHNDVDDPTVVGFCGPVSEDFVQCPACAAKTGVHRLCDSCHSNKVLIHNLKMKVHDIEVDYEVEQLRQYVMSSDKKDFFVTRKNIETAKEPSLKVEDAEQIVIVQAIEKFQGNLSKAAGELG